jgi:perosamine synthetase
MSFRCFGDEELANLREVIESQNLWRLKENGFVVRLEQAFAAHLGRRYVHALSTGTSADEAALFGLGLEPGDEVICPASAPLFVSMPVVAIGCIPVLADADPRTLILSAAGIRARITPRTRAILVVHLFGQPAPMDEILAVAREHGLKVVEDCAQAYDCTWRGRKAGTLGDVAAFSLQQSKHISCGEGGLVATDDPEIY